MIVQYFILTGVAFFFDVVLIALHVAGRLPFGVYDFIFILVLALAVSLYRPRYVFWLFIAALPLENIILTPAEFPIALRPFQLLGGVLVVATLILWAFRKLEFRLISLRKICVICSLIDKRRARSDRKISGSSQTQDSSQTACCGPTNSFGFFDRLVFLLPIFAIIGAYFAPVRAVAAKQALVLISFVALYWLARNFLQSKKEKFEAIWFFLIGTKVVISYAFYQAIAFKLGWPHFEVMPGRVSSTFTEPDWLGMYIVFAIALMLWTKLFAIKYETNIRVAGYKPTALITLVGNLFLFASLFVLLLTVARSAWLAMAGVLLVYVFLILMIKGDLQQSLSSRLRRTGFESAMIIIVGVLSFFVIAYYQLSSFHFLNRAASSVSGKQKITVSCETGSSVPEDINSVDELARFNCRHINLEEIDQERQQGRDVKEVYRPDPNVEIRKNIYLASWEQIKKQPITGHGIGSAPFFLGQDERGAGLNTSNIFLEAWFSMGIIGLLIIIMLLVIIPLLAFIRLLQRRQIIAASFILLTATVIFLPNMFNAGLLIGFFWIWLAIATELGNDLAKS